MLYTVVLAGALWLLNRKKRFPGFVVSFLAVTYAPVRFGLDFLRTVDKRYLGLTPGQYFSIALFLLGIWLWYTRSKAPPEEFEPYNFRTGKGGVLPPDGAKSGHKLPGRKSKKDS